jgi:hypothetical protein
VIPGDGHLGDDLSALLDGELSAEQEAAARAHLDGCASCRDELAAVEDARQMLRALPFVDPPAGFLDGFIGRRHRRRRVAVAAAGFASVATLLTIVAAGPMDDVPDLAPQPEDLAAAHLEPGANQPMDNDDMDDDIPVVTRLARFERTDMFDDGDMTHVVLSAPGAELSVFEGYGELEWDTPPGGGHRMEVEVGDGSAEAWMCDVEGTDASVLVVEAGDLVYALVSDLPMETLVEAAADLPEAGDPALVERARTVVVRMSASFRP